MFLICEIVKIVKSMRKYYFGSKNLSSFEKLKKKIKKYHWKNALQFKIQIFEWFSKFKMKKSQKSQIVMTTISQYNAIFRDYFTTLPSMVA